MSPKHFFMVLYDINTNPVMKIENTTKIPMKHNGPMRGGGGLLPKSPPFDENFDLEGDKVCSREILLSSDTIETVTMPKNSKTHTYI